MNTCPFCNAQNDQVKAGRNASGSQRMKCKRCQKKYTLAAKTKSYPPEIRMKAVRLYLEGCSFREIALKLQVNHQSVINWVNEYAMSLPKPVARSLSRR